MLERSDRPETLFYLDPPYWGCETDYGQDIFRRSDLEDMADRLGELQGRLILSPNDTPGVRATFAGFELIKVQTTYSMGTKERGAGQVANELIITDQKGEALGPLFG